MYFRWCPRCHSRDVHDAEEVYQGEDDNSYWGADYDYDNEGNPFYFFEDSNGNGWDCHCDNCGLSWDYGQYYYDYKRHDYRKSC